MEFIPVMPTMITWPLYNARRLDRKVEDNSYIRIDDRSVEPYKKHIILICWGLTFPSCPCMAMLLVIASKVIALNLLLHFWMQLSIFQPPTVEAAGLLLHCRNSLGLVSSLCGDMPHNIAQKTQLGCHWAPQLGYTVVYKLASTHLARVFPVILHPNVIPPETIFVRVNTCSEVMSDKTPPQNLSLHHMVKKSSSV